MFLHNLPHSRFGFAEGIFYFTIIPTSYKNLHADIASELFQYANDYFHVVYTKCITICVRKGYTMSDENGLPGDAKAVIKYR